MSRAKEAGQSEVVRQMSEASTDNPWQTVSTETRYDNPWITVTHNQVINPAGNNGIYGKVHFKNKGIAILPLDEDNNTWLVGQYRYTINAYSWEIPEGGGADTSTPLETAKRELLEETGIEASRWTEILYAHMSNSVTDERAYGFIAQDLQFTTAQPEETEALSLIKLPFDEALDMALSGKITDILAVTCLLKAAHLLEKGII